MKRIILFQVCVFLLVSWISLPAAETIAVVLKAKGKVEVFRGNVSKGSPVDKGFRLENGDKLTTGEKSYAAVRFIDDASLVRIRANSTCTIKGTKEQNKVSKNVYLEVGTLFARIAKQKGKFEVSTPTSVASVKGTGFITDQKESGDTFYYGEEGLVEITNDAGTALLHKDETAHVVSRKTAPVVRKTKAGEKPTLDEDERAEDDFEFEFENEAGQKKMLKFKAQKK